MSEYLKWDRNTLYFYINIAMCKMRYCEGAKMSLSDRLLARILGLGRTILKMQQSNMAYFS